MFAKIDVFIVPTFWFELFVELSGVHHPQRHPKWPFGLTIAPARSVLQHPAAAILVPCYTSSSFVH